MLSYIARVRIALVSMIESAEDDSAMLRAALKIAGRNIAERQLDLALTLGCERIICLAEGLAQPVIALQHQAEAAGAKFNIVNGSRQLLGLVTSTDELVVFSEGLLPTASEATEALAKGAGVLVFPVEKGVAAGFERIDLNHAWAGILSLPGRLVERLSELPPDCDAVSSLLRIALQGRVSESLLPENLLDGGRWVLVGSRATLAGLEKDWFRRHAAPPSPIVPGRAIARLAVRRFGGGLLSKGWRPVWFSGAGGLVVLGAVGAAWYGFLVAAIAACGVGWLLGEAGSALGQIAGAGFGGKSSPRNRWPILGILVDLSLICVLTLGLYGTWSERAFPPLVLLGLLRIGQRQISVKWVEILQDRAVLALVLALPAAFLLLLPAIQVLSIALIAALLGLTSGSTKLTRT